MIFTILRSARTTESACRRGKKKSQQLPSVQAMRIQRRSPISKKGRPYITHRVKAAPMRCRKGHSPTAEVKRAPRKATRQEHQPSAKCSRPHTCQVAGCKSFRPMWTASSSAAQSRRNPFSTTIASLAIGASRAACGEPSASSETARESRGWSTCLEGREYCWARRIEGAVPSHCRRPLNGPYPRSRFFAWPGPRPVRPKRSVQS